MATIIQVQKTFQELSNRKTIEKLLFEEVKRFSSLIIDIQQERLSKGKNTEGLILGTYKRSTELASLFGELKPRQPKREGEPYNFEWTGGFFDGMQLNVFDDKAEFISKGESTQDLLKKHDDLMGLDEEGRQSALEEFLFNAFADRIRNKAEIL